jgi:hypothetical protein
MKSQRIEYYIILQEIEAQICRIWAMKNRYHYIDDLKMLFKHRKNLLCKLNQFRLEEFGREYRRIRYAKMETS